MSTQELLEDSLKDPYISQTSRFYWHATPIGIAALSRHEDQQINETLYEDAIKEGLEVGIDLAREEREWHYSSKGLVLLFYS